MHLSDISQTNPDGGLLNGQKHDIIPPNFTLYIFYSSLWVVRSSQLMQFLACLNLIFENQIYMVIYFSILSNIKRKKSVAVYCLSATTNNCQFHSNFLETFQVM